MFQIPFGVLLREAREQAGLSGVDLARLAGTDRRRISAFESGTRFPTISELEFLLKALPLEPMRVRYALQQQCDDTRTLISNGRRYLQEKPYFPRVQEPAYRRYLAAYAAFPTAMPAMVKRLRARKDYPQIFNLTKNMRFDSADEVLSLTHIFDVGAIPALLAPNTCAAPPARIVDKQGKQNVGHRHHACLLYQNRAIFHQVTFATAPRQTVDLLVWDGSCWEVWEVDGLGHDARGDLERQEALGIFVRRYSTDVILEAARQRLPYFAEVLRLPRAA